MCNSIVLLCNRAYYIITVGWIQMHKTIGNAVDIGGLGS